MNELFAEHFPLAAKLHRKNGIQRRVWRQFTLLAADNTLYCLPNIALDLDISSYINAYFHLNYLFQTKVVECVAKFAH